MTYFYVDKKDLPILVCPDCGQEWNIPGGIKLVTSTGDLVLEHETELESDGGLADVDDLVLNGYHSATLCAGCGAMLQDLPGVHEQSQED